MKIKAVFLSVLLILITTVYISAAGQSEKTDTPQRIVIAGRATIMLMDALYLFDGMEDKVVARGETNQGLGDFFPVIDSKAAEKPNLGKNPGPEEILSHNPDLVILKNYMKKSLGQPIEDLGIRVLYLDLETDAAISKDIMTLGEVLGQEKRAIEVIEYLTSLKSFIGTKVSAAPKTKSLFLYPKAGDSGFSFQVPAKGWIQEEQVTLAGGLPLWTEQTGGSGWKDVSFEQIAAWAPDALFIVDYRKNPKTAVDAVMENTLWADIPAVKNAQVFAVPADYYSWGQADTRWILGALWMASKLHPESVSAQDVAAKTTLFFKDLYGLSNETLINDILPRLKG